MKSGDHILSLYFIAGLNETGDKLIAKVNPGEDLITIVKDTGNNLWPVTKRRYLLPVSWTPVNSLSQSCEYQFS